MPLGNRDAAEMLFEPTGDLGKDYSAYCETADKVERDDVLEAVQIEELSDPPVGTAKHVINFNMRNIDYCLNKRDAEPLAQAIPHCKNLQRVSLTSCGLTEHSYKLFVKAVYKSPSVTSFAADFNPNQLFKDPTVSKKDKNEVLVNPADFKGGYLKPQEPEVKEEKKGKADPKKQAAVKEEPIVEKPPISLPTGWHAMLYTGIQQLSLRGNAINDKQLELLCPLLEVNSDLLSLSLWGNEITCVGCGVLGAALKKNRKLTALNLGHNKISDAGIASLAACFYTQDVTNEEALQARQLVYPQQSELPLLPTYTDLCSQANQGIGDEKKDQKKKDAGKGKKVEGPVERHKTDFDKDCVRLDEHHVRIPGNSTLWSLNLSHNVEVGAQGIAALVNALQSNEPNYEMKEAVSSDFVFPTPSHYVACCPLEHVEVHHPSLDQELKRQLSNALATAATKRGAQASKQ